MISALVVLGVMQVSVRRRTSELGLRKAVGADEPEVRGPDRVGGARSIALAGCTIGAVLAGVTLYATAPLLARKFGFVGIGLSPSAILIGVLAALATGALGAWLPARKAGRPRPRHGAKDAVVASALRGDWSALLVGSRPDASLHGFEASRARPPSSLVLTSKPRGD